VREEHRSRFPVVVGDHVVPGKVIPRFFFLSRRPAFVERDSRRRVAGFSWSSISWGTCTLSRRVYPRSDGPRRRSVYAVKP